MWRSMETSFGVAFNSTPSRTMLDVRSEPSRSTKVPCTQLRQVCQQWSELRVLALQSLDWGEDAEVALGRRPVCDTELGS
jgi:hypothetical protein